MRAAQGVRLRIAGGPPAFAPVILLAPVMCLQYLTSANRAVRPDKEVKGETGNHERMRPVILSQESNAPFLVWSAQVLHRRLAKSKPKSPSRAASWIPGVLNRRHAPIEQVWPILVRTCLQAPRASRNRRDSHGIRAPRTNEPLKLNLIRCVLWCHGVRYGLTTSISDPAPIDAQHGSKT